MRGRILLVHLLSLVAGGLVLLRVNRHQWFFGDEWEFLGGVRRTTAVVRPAPPAPQRALEHGAVPHLSPARSGVRDSLVLAVHRPRDPVAPRRRPPRVAGDAAGQDHAVGGHRRRAAAARSRSRLPEPALGVPDRVPRLGRARPRNDAARQPRRERGSGETGPALALVVFALLWSGVSVLLVVVCALVVLLRRGIKPAAAFAIPPAVVYIVWAVAYPPPTNLAAPSVQRVRRHCCGRTSPRA